MAKRLQNELMQFLKSPPGGATAQTVNDDLFHWTVKLPGPAGSPYEGAIYTIDITFPEKYPHEKPLVRFVPALYHPNIDDKGEFCYGDYKATMKVLDIIKTALNLLSTPNTGLPVNAVAAQQYVENPAEFRATVKKQIASLQ